MPRVASSSTAHREARKSSTKGKHIQHHDALPKYEACLTCKARKIKCDSLRPACTACVRSAKYAGRDPASCNCVYGQKKVARTSSPPPSKKEAVAAPVAAQQTEEENFDWSFLTQEVEAAPLALPQVWLPEHYSLPVLDPIAPPRQPSETSTSYFPELAPSSPTSSSGSSFSTATSFESTPSLTFEYDSYLTSEPESIYQLPFLTTGPLFTPAVAPVPSFSLPDLSTFDPSQLVSPFPLLSTGFGGDFTGEPWKSNAVGMVPDWTKPSLEMTW
ncbi:hypothetical protein MNV49_006415 [Pseudohyphozyma bogoriensis]|nr:hypothetical protein MNV49_006415 [Pseudohyphozyma bogoriensis]